MSFINFHKLSSTVQRLHNLHKSPFIRFQSTSNKSKGSGSKLAFYGVALTTSSLVGTLAYANYDQQFKQTANSYVPGFGALTDRSAVLWQRGVISAGEGWQKLKDVITPERTGVGIQTDIPLSDRPVNNEPLTLSSDKPTESQSDKPTESQSDKPTESQSDKTTESQSDKPTESQSDKLLDDRTVSNKPVDDKIEPLVNKPVSNDDNKILTSSDISLDDKTDNDISTQDEGRVSVPQDTVIQATDDNKLSTETQTTIAKDDNVPVTVPTDQKPESETSSFVVPDTIELQSKSQTDTLRESFQEFLTASDELILSFKNLAQALTTYNLQVSESEKAQDDDKVVKGAKEAVDVAKEQLQVAKDKQYEISLKLAEDVMAISKEGAADALVEKVCDTVAKYTKELIDNEQNLVDIETAGFAVKEPFNEFFDDKETLLGVLKSQVEELENRIALMKEEEKKKLEKALKEQLAENETATKEKINSLVEEKEREFMDRLEQMELELEKKYEGKLKDHLLSQAEAYKFHIKESLEKQAEHLSTHFEEEYYEKLKEVKDDHQLKLAAALAHLKGIHSVIDTVAEASQTSRREQNVRAASDALVNAIITANNDPNPFTKHSISHEVTTLLKAAKDDVFINTVLSSLPKEALIEGISSENGLKTRFEKVKKVCSRVSLIPEEGGGLGLYLLSFLQSLLTIDMIHSKMADLSRVDPSNMATSTLLRQAKIHLDHGDLETAVKLMGQLNGEARRVADDWLREAVLYLEIRQAIMAVSQYIAAASVCVSQ